MRRPPTTSLRRYLPFVRRAALPVLILAIAIGGVVMSDRANADADPGIATAVDPGPDLITPIMSARRVPAWLREPTSDNLLSDAIGDVLNGAPTGTCVKVTRGDMLIADNNTTEPIQPGALQRLLTLSALDSLGGSGFRTEVAISAGAEIDEDGVLRGDIYLIGGGDPVLSTRPFIDRFGDDRAFTNFTELAGQTIIELQTLGVTAINGRVVGDESKYEDISRDYQEENGTGAAGVEQPIWTTEQVASNVVGPLSALLVNNGFAEWPTSVDPTLNIRVDNPAASAAQLLDSRLEAAGIDVSNNPGIGDAPALLERQTVAIIDSPPLEEILPRSLVDATTAEMLLIEISVRSGSEPSRLLGSLYLVTGGLTAAGLPFDIISTRPFDGSGLSSLNRTTCSMLHAAVESADSAAASALPPIDQTSVSACAPQWVDDLRVLASSDGATTGLAGRFSADNGDEVVFSMLVDDPTRLVADEEPVAEGEEPPEPVGPFESCNHMQAALLDAIGGHPYGPRLETLSPLEAAGR